MRSRVKEVSEGLVVEIDDLADQRDTVLETFTACREGRCNCPTDEYQKLASLEIEEDGTRLKLHLQAKAGAKFEMSEVARCLEFNGIDSDG